MAKSKKGRSKEPAKEKVDPLVEVLVEVEAHGIAGMALAAPATLEGDVPALRYTASGSLSQADRKKLLEGMRLLDFLEPAGERAVTLRGKGKKARQREIALPLYRLSRNGGERLADWRAQRERSRRAALDERKAEVEGLRVAVEEHGEAVEATRQDLAGLRDDLRAIGGDIARHLDLLGGRVDRLDRSLGDIAVHGRELAGAVREAIPEALARAGESAGPTEAPAAPEAAVSDGSVLLARVLASIPADRWIEIPALHRELESGGTRLGSGALRDILLALAARDQVAFQPWNRTIYEIPDPDHAILRPEARVFYYVKRVGRDGVD